MINSVCIAWISVWWTVFLNAHVHLLAIILPLHQCYFYITELLLVAFIHTATAHTTIPLSCQCHYSAESSSPFSSRRDIFICMLDPVSFCSLQKPLLKWDCHFSLDHWIIRKAFPSLIMHRSSGSSSNAAAVAVLGHFTFHYHFNISP